VAERRSSGITDCSQCQSLTASSLTASSLTAALRVHASFDEFESAFGHRLSRTNVTNVWTEFQDLDTNKVHIVLHDDMNRVWMHVDINGVC
jgi:hypothetical protein